MAHYHATCDTAPVGLNVDSVDSGEQRLSALGYKQALRRKFTLVSNTAISLSIISTLLGITGKPLTERSRTCKVLVAICEAVSNFCRAHAGSMPIAYSNGGSPTAVWGFVLVACMTMAVGLSMAEIVSSLPSSKFQSLVSAFKHGRDPCSPRASVVLIRWRAILLVRGLLLGK